MPANILFVIPLSLCASTLRQLLRSETCIRITSALKLEKLLGKEVVYAELHNDFFLSAIMKLVIYNTFIKRIAVRSTVRVVRLWSVYGSSGN